ncbi:hypothetical protein BCR44DRAFT_38733 [Catenaria anguillulae PL171]|uniref:Uncharacterized protein n=1 Tax=Catenaria anguillulae PL171 TaxID=765915 RepID=A0A1Y2HBA3_9FUNG|nr:hypothetical protein BCR44DRAFT_38733 [Catenaria anguillulae PL171]
MLWSSQSAFQQLGIEWEKTPRNAPFSCHGYTFQVHSLDAQHKVAHQVQGHLAQAKRRRQCKLVTRFRLFTTIMTVIGELFESIRRSFLEKDNLKEWLSEGRDHTAGPTRKPNSGQQPTD